jgi:hypothetical protein
VFTTIYFIVTYKWVHKVKVFVPDKLMFSSKAFLGAPLFGRPLALPVNIRLGWKSQLGTNILAY